MLPHPRSARHLGFLLVFVGLLYHVGQATAATYFVRVSGNDANTGLSAGLAFRTIDRARTIMQKGDTCYVGAGTYTEPILLTRDGDAANPIRFIADTNGTFTGDSGAVLLASTDSWIVEGNGADHNQFHNFTFQPTAATASTPLGLYLYKCQHFALVGCTLRHLQIGISTVEADTTISGCRFENIQQHPIYALKKNVLVTDTVITGAGSYAVHHSWSSSTDDTLTLRNCTITHNQCGPYVNNTRLALDNCTLEHNTTWGAAVVDSKLTLTNMARGIRFNGGGLFLSQATVPDLYYNGDDSLTDGGPDHHIINNLDLSDNQIYGLYSSNCNIRLLGCKIENTGGYALGLAHTELRDATGTVIRNNAGGIIGWTNERRKKLKIEKLTLSGNAGHGIVLYGSSTVGDDKLELKDSVISSIAGWSCYVEHANVVCKNSRLEGSLRGVRAWHPTAPSSLGKCELDNCVIQDIAEGDGLHVSHSTVTVKTSTFARVAGYGLQCLYGPLTVENSTFTNVGDSDQYAIYSYHPGPVTSGSPLTKIKGCTITNCGGGVYADRTHLELDAVTISGSESWALGLNYGNISWSGAGNKIVRNNGRGMYVAGNTLGQSERRFKDWQFVDNGEYGLYAADCTLVLENCTVQRMASWGLGVAYATFAPVNTIITNNGAGVAMFSDSNLAAPEIRNATINGNQGTAIMHQSVAARPGTARIQSCTVTANGGWGLLGQDGYIDCQSTTFANNTRGIHLEQSDGAPNSGQNLFKQTLVRSVVDSDAMYCSGASLRLEHCIVEQCSRGGVLCYGQALTAIYTTIRNTGSSEDYAVYHYYHETDPSLRGQTRLDSCTITGNDNGPYAHQTDLTLDNCSITGNRGWGILSVHGELLVAAAERAIHDNGYGLYVEGNPSQNRRLLEGWNTCRNGSYGIYAADCDLQLQDCVIEQMTDWGLGIANATVTASNSPIRYNGRGVEITSGTASRAPALTAVEVCHNTTVGIQHTTDPAHPRVLTLSDCQVHDNGAEALISVDAWLYCADTTFQNNERGLRLVRAAADRGQGSHQFVASMIGGTRTLDGIFSEYADATFTGCTVDNNAGHGIAWRYGDLTLDGCTVQGHIRDNTYGVYLLDGQPPRADWSHLIVKDSALIDNFGGLYADQGHVTIDNGTIEGNLAWGIGCAHGELDFVNQARAVNHNGSGLLVIGNTDGAARYLENFDVSENGSYGIFAVDCDLVLDQCQIHDMQSWGLGLSNASLRVINTPIVNNGNGIHIQTIQGQRETVLDGVHIRNSQHYAVYHESPPATPGVLRLRHCRLEQYGQYGLVSTYGSLTLEDTQVQGDPTRSGNGVYVLDAPLAQLDRTTILGNQFWGLLTYGTNLAVRNSVVCHNDGGIYSFHNDAVSTSMTILNSTLAENPAYGVVQYRGESTLVNNILATSLSGGVGLQVDAGQMQHTHNLLFGYTLPTQGTDLGTDEIVGPPRFADAASGDFHLVGSSMAINRGADLSGQNDHDRDGNSRPMFGKWDIGAYEYTNPSESAHVVEWREIE